MQMALQDPQVTSQTTYDLDRQNKLQDWWMNPCSREIRAVYIEKSFSKVGPIFVDGGSWGVVEVGYEQLLHVIEAEKIMRW